MIVGFTRTVLLMAEIIAHITIVWQCFMAIVYALMGFHHVETIEKVYEGFAELFLRQGIWVASMAITLAGIAGVHALILRVRVLESGEKQDYWKSRVEDKIAWGLIIAIPAISYSLSILWRAQSVSVNEEMEKQILFVLVGFSLTAGVSLRLWRGAYLRVEEHLT